MPQTANDDEFGKYRDYLMILARSRIAYDLRGRIDPSDVVQETICAVLRDQPRERTGAEMMGRLRFKLGDILIDRLRRLKLERRGVSLDSLLEQTSNGMSRIVWAVQSGPGAQVLRDELALELAEMLGKLTAAQAEALVLMHCEGMTVKEVCRHMNKTPDAVGGLLRHGMRRLRGLMSRRTEL